MLDPLELYRCLNLNPTADDKTIKENYRDLAKFWHPDHNTDPKALENFQKISTAYNILKNKKDRRMYDLLSLIYQKQDFPDMESLKTYKSVNGLETPFLRVFKLYRKNFKTVKEENLIGTFTDAATFIENISKQNLLKGWWPLSSVQANIKVLKDNYHNINLNKADNFKLLAHNMACYFQKDDLEKAWLSGIQALEYADDFQKQAVENFLRTLPASRIPVPTWNYEILKKIQLRFPFFILGILAVSVLSAGIILFSSLNFSDNKTSKISYYQQVRFATGGETVDDLVTSKIFNIPVNLYDDTMLYHTKETTKVMYGPSENFDMIINLPAQKTVRITGYTPDQEWYRIMLDNGDMGFVKTNQLKKGIGQQIPVRSKIIAQ